MKKAFGVVTAIRDDKLTLYKKPNMSKSNVEKEDLTKQIESVKEDVPKVKKEAQGKIVKAYKLICIYFVSKSLDSMGKAQTQWDKVVNEI
jgi:hypothetical protein